MVNVRHLNSSRVAGKWHTSLDDARLKSALDCWQVRETHESLRKRRLDEFMAGFNAISLKLKEMYQMITLGGDAELELVDSLDPFSEVRCPWHARYASVAVSRMIISPLK